MFLLIGFAFLAGIFTVLSPCILPVLPAILSGGIAKGRLRPLGIISGLVISFTFFTLALTAIVHATGLSPNVLRYFAIFLIGFFGLVMIFPSLSDQFAKLTAPIANVGSTIQGTNKKEGFWSGFIFGIALGLLWTPCAGPILAAITTLVATQSINFITILITFAYSLGAGIPLFLIAYGGSKAVQSSRFLTKYTEQIRQFFGVLMILSAVAIALHWDMILQQQITRFFPPIMIEDNELVKQALTNLRKEGDGDKKPLFIKEEGKGGLAEYGKAPELTGIVNWINSPPLSLMQLKGQVILIDFWTYSCINCLRTLPYIEKWYDDYKDKGFIVIGVHTPEFEFEKDPQNVTEAVARLGVRYPVAQDNDFKTWQAYQNHYWPAHYLIDQQGNVRMIHFGEGGYVETENAIRQLLGNLSPIVKEEPTKSTRPISPETYLGAARGNSYTTEITILPNLPSYYQYKTPLKDDHVGLKGNWIVEEERITSKGPDSFLDYHFLATRVYLVLSGSSATPIEVFIDGKPTGNFIMNGNQKYDIAVVPYGRHQLSIKIPAGVSAYAFTFGDE